MRPMFIVFAVIYSASASETVVPPFVLHYIGTCSMCGINFCDNQRPCNGQGYARQDKYVGTADDPNYPKATIGKQLGGLGCDELPDPIVCWTGKGNIYAVTDANECDTQNGGCHANANCVNTWGSRTCDCKPGYSGDGLSCTVKYTCSTGGGSACKSCAGVSSRTVNNHCATCNTGYKISGTNCVVKYTCSTGGGSACKSCAVVSSRTVNNHCTTCNTGYKISGTNCVGKSCTGKVVDNGAVLSGNFGETITVTCDDGYEPSVPTTSCSASLVFPPVTCDGKSCTGKVVDNGADLSGNFGETITVTCNDGYEPSVPTTSCSASLVFPPVTCDDANECDTQNGGCDANANCVNTVGSRTCECKPRYYGDGLSCTDRFVKQASVDCKGSGSDLLQIYGSVEYCKQKCLDIRCRGFVANAHGQCLFRGGEVTVDKKNLPDSDCYRLYGCFIKISGTCAKHQMLENIGWFDDSSYGGPTATTDEACSNRKSGWESTCSNDNIEYRFAEDPSFTCAAGYEWASNECIECECASGQSSTSELCVCEPCPVGFICGGGSSQPVPLDILDGILDLSSYQKTLSRSTCDDAYTEYAVDGQALIGGDRYISCRTGVEAWYRVELKHYTIDPIVSIVTRDYGWNCFPSVDVYIGDDQGWASNTKCATLSSVWDPNQISQSLCKGKGKYVYFVVSSSPCQNWKLILTEVSVRGINADIQGKIHDLEDEITAEKAKVVALQADNTAEKAKVKALQDDNIAEKAKVKALQDVFLEFRGSLKSRCMN